MDTTALIVRAVDERTDNRRAQVRDAVEATGHCGSSREPYICSKETCSDRLCTRIKPSDTACTVCRSTVKAVPQATTIGQACTECSCKTVVACAPVHYRVGTLTSLKYGSEADQRCTTGLSHDSSKASTTNITVLQIVVSLEW